MSNKGNSTTTTVYPLSQRLKSQRAVEQTRLSNLSWVERRRNVSQTQRTKSGWKRETHILPRMEAREFARSFLKKYPKAAYWTEVESWRVLEDDVIEFTMRRLPSAD